MYYFKQFFLGAPTIVKTDILIRSMGPITEVDMVSKNTEHSKHQHQNAKIIDQRRKKRCSFYFQSCLLRKSISLNNDSFRTGFMN